MNLRLRRNYANGCCGQSYFPSESYFPTPRGGAYEEWAEDYRKAQLLVERMTLMEKINITTGTGWQMGLCVGNTGTLFENLS